MHSQSLRAASWPEEPIAGELQWQSKRRAKRSRATREFEESFCFSGACAASSGGRRTGYMSMRCRQLWTAVTVFCRNSLIFSVFMAVSRRRQGDTRRRSSGPLRLDPAAFSWQFPGGCPGPAGRRPALARYDMSLSPNLDITLEARRPYTLALGGRSVASWAASYCRRAYLRWRL